MGVTLALLIFSSAYCMLLTVAEHLNLIRHLLRSWSAESVTALVFDLWKVFVRKDKSAYRLPCASNFH